MSKKKYPKVTITVPPDVKARMEAAKGSANWSAIASRAISEHLDLMDKTEELHDVSIEAIDRLKRSKQRTEANNVEFAQHAGKRWAETRAEWDELVRVAEAADAGFPNNGTAHEALAGALQIDATQFWVDVLGATPSDGSVQAFTDGALAVFSAVKRQL